MPIGNNCLIHFELAVFIRCVTAGKLCLARKVIYKSGGMVRQFTNMCCQPQIDSFAKTWKNLQFRTHPIYHRSYLVYKTTSVQPKMQHHAALATYTMSTDLLPPYPSHSHSQDPDLRRYPPFNLLPPSENPACHHGMMQLRRYLIEIPVLSRLRCPRQCAWPKYRYASRCH